MAQAVMAPAALLLLLSGPCWAAGKKPLSLTAWVEPSSALPGQPLTVRLKWTNVMPAGSAPLAVNRRGVAGAEVSLVLEDGRGRRVALAAWAPARPAGAADWQTLASGESFEYAYDLSARLLSPPLRPGEYALRAAYENKTAFGEPPAWVGRLQAAPARFRIRREAP